MHKAWFGIREMPYCFPKSSIKFQGHTGQKIKIWTRIWHFRIVTPAWIDGWLWNDAQRLKYHTRCTLLFFKGICQIARSNRTKKITDFDPTWCFQFELINGYEMMHKAWSSIEEVPYCISRPSIKFQGYTGQKINDFDLNLAFLDCT